MLQLALVINFVLTQPICHTLIRHLNLLWVFLFSIFLLLLMLAMMLVVSMMNHLVTVELISPKSTKVGCRSNLFMLQV
jgi:hypothetical protein